MFANLSHLIRPNAESNCYGVAVCDLLGEGGWQFAVCGFGSPNRILKWDGLALVDRTPTLLSDPSGRAVSCAAGDVDGDGVEELYVLNADTYSGPARQPDRLFRRTGGRWHDLLSEPRHAALRNLASGRSVAVVDRRGSGRYGFFVANYGRPYRFLERGSDGMLVDVASALGLDATTGGRSLWVGPLASELPDLFCGNEHGPNFLFRNTGSGTFLEIAAPVRVDDQGEHARGVAGFDANDDGHFDLAVGNWDGPNRLFVREPDGTFRDRATPAMAFPGPVRTVIAADFDNDGYEELFFHFLGEPNRLFRRVHDPRQALEWVQVDLGEATEAEGLGTGAAVADVNGDGVLELLLAHGERAAQPLGLYRAEAGRNNWLRVIPRTRFGAPARGAVVRMKAGGRTQLRVIDGGSGYLCQMEPVAHFGLGEWNSVEEVRVTWPDGATVCVPHPPICTVLDVPFPA